MADTVPNKRKLCRTFYLFLAFFGLGLCIAISGPTLLDLEQAVNTTTDYISCIYPARSVGYLTGSIIGGVLFDRYNRQLLLVVVLLTAAATAVIPPWCTDITTLVSDFVASGIALGMLDTSANVWCLDMWKQESGPYIQALHFSFGVGAVIAPLIAEPFLSQPIIFSPALTLSKSEGTQLLNSTTINITINGTATESPEQSQRSFPRIVYAYGIVGAYIFLIALIVFVEALSNPSGTKRCPDPIEKAKNSTQRTKVIALISLAGLFFCAYSGLEVAFGQYLTSFVVKSELKLTKSTGSFLTSIYWGSYTLFRGIAIACAKLMNVESMLLMDVTLLVIANSLLTAFGSKSIVALCLGAIILGAGVSSLFPSTFAYLEGYIDVSNKIASIFMVTASFGEMVLPIVIGHYIDDFPMVLMFVNLACGCLCFLVFFLMRKAAQTCGSKYHPREPQVPNEHSTIGRSVNSEYDATGNSPMSSALVNADRVTSSETDVMLAKC